MICLESNGSFRITNRDDKYPVYNPTKCLGGGGGGKKKKSKKLFQIFLKVFYKTLARPK